MIKISSPKNYKTSPNFPSTSSDVAVLLFACGSFLQEKSKELFLLANGIHKLTNWHHLISWLLFSDTSYANTKLRWRSVQSEFLTNYTWSRAGPANIKTCNVNVTQNVTHIQQNTFHQTHTHIHTEIFASNFEFPQNWCDLLVSDNDLSVSHVLEL